LSAGEGLDGLGHVLQRADAQLGHGRAGVAAHPVLVDHPQDGAQDPGPAPLAAQVEIAGDVEGRRHREGLVDGLDAGVQRVLRSPEVHRLPIHEELAGVRNEGTGQALDQRRLARAVVADDAQHLARVEVEVDAIESDDPPERLDHAAGGKNRCCHVASSAERSASSVMLPPPLKGARRRSCCLLR
jgi:hypothetical protein